MLGLSLGASAVYSLVAIAGRLTREESLRDQTATLNPSLSDRPVFDLIYQFLAIFFDLVPVVLAVFLLNALGLSLGYFAAHAFGLAPADRRAVSIEVGIQNSGLGLILIFNFFGGLGGMAVVAAWWGIWHILAGLALATWWRRHPPPAPPELVTA